MRSEREIDQEIARLQRHKQRVAQLAKWEAEELHDRILQKRHVYDEAKKHNRLSPMMGKLMRRSIVRDMDRFSALRAGKRMGDSEMGPKERELLWGDK
jgi:hypothetical protein